VLRCTLMDLYRAIEELYEEKRRVEQAIAALENHGSVAPAPTRRRGRKSMNEEERKQVSERMRKYWESRREPAPD
jgi:hypothetical protein